VSESTPYLSIVFPVYREEKRIAPTLTRVIEYLRAGNRTFEILVVNDGSGDNTLGVAREAAAAVGCEIRTLDRAENRGKGYTVREGLLAARGAYRLFSDADLSTPIEELEKLLVPLEAGQADIAIGSRALPDSVLEVHQPWWREMSGRTFNLAVRAAGMPDFADTQCGFKLFTARAAEEIFPLQTLERWGFDVEVLWIAKTLGFRAVEVPVHWVNSADSRVSTLAGISAFGDIARVRWRHLRGRYRRGTP
jgi:dolichyl-phosphate beta-glucosyltransferase